MNDSNETIKRVAEEGLEARNLINWIADGCGDGIKTTGKPPTSPRTHFPPKSPTTDVDSRLLLKTKRRATLSRPKSRLRSASAGRNPEKDLRARYWTFLFENLHRAVDEIYQTCEMDESIVESKEAIMMLENYSKDFHALIQYININKNYEKTAPINRPTSLAWEVRKSSPGKSMLKNVFIEKLTAGNCQAKRILCFDSPSDSQNISAETMLLKSESKPAANKETPEKIQAEECQMGCLDLKDSSIAISVVQETNDIFPCNDGLIVNEICCLSDKISADKPSTIIEAESESASADTESVSSILNIDMNKDAIGIASVEEKTENSAKEEFSGKIKDELDKNEEEICLENSSGVCEEFRKIAVDTSVHEIKSETAALDENSRKNENVLIKCNESIETELKGEENKYFVNSSEEKLNEISESSLSTSNGESTSKKSSAQVMHPKDGDKIPLKKKVLVKKSSKVVISEKLSSAHSVCKQSASIDEKNISKNSVRSTNASIKTIDKDKIANKVLTKDSETNVNKESNDNSASTKSSSTVMSVKKTLTIKPTTEKSASAKPASVVQKTASKVDNFADEKKPVKSYSKTSAIQRNISYVSTLSSKNQLQKAASEEKKNPTRPVRTISHAMRLPHHKSGSLSSLHKITTARRWNDKASSVEQIPEIIKSTADEDSDGWEMVRSRNRCRNSPAKKIPFSSEKNDKALDIAKLNQSRFGGFPYTTKNSSKAAQNKVGKVSNKEKQSKAENTSPRSNHSDTSSPQVNLKKLSNSSMKNSSKLSLGSDVNNKLEYKSISSEKVIDKICDNNKLDLELLAGLKLPEEVSRKISNNLFKLNPLIKSASVPCLNEFGKNNSFSKTRSLSELSLAMKKHSKMKHIRSSVEKFFNSARKKGRKATKSQDSTTEENSLSISLDESDPGLTSDDQDGQTSHDEAYDAQCQELYDTAWKYKILEQQVHKLELSWGEQMDRFDMELRTPGRALEMHEKLSSPFRKKSLMESIRLQEEKQAKAREQRERLLEEKLQKIKEIEKKRQEMKTLSEQRQEKQRALMEQKLQRAEEKRKKQLQMIIRKAHDEEEKVNEIAFINSLEAQNKRHDLISKEKDHEARLHDIQEERQRKQEEKAAKEAAAEERRKLLEAERQARLNEMQEKRKMRDHKVEQLFLVKEKERQELANQKARDREQRLSALNIQQQISIEELQKKIQLKQEESARRHEENMEQIRQKAFELSVRRCSSNNDDAPQPVPYETKKICTMCNVLIGSEVYLLSHLRGKKHQEIVKDQYQGKDPTAEELELYNLKHIVDASTDQLDPNIAFDKERQKALKKRCKKLRQRMSNKGQEYESQLEKSTDSVNSNVKIKMTKIIADIKKLITSYEKSSNDSNLLSALDRCLREIDNVLEKKLYQDKVSFRIVGGLGAVIDIFKLVSSLPMEKSAFLHKRIINNLNNTAESIIEKCHENCLYILFSNRIGCLLDLLIQRLNVLIPNNYNQVSINNSKSLGFTVQVDVTAGKLMHFMSKILLTLSAKSSQLLQSRLENASQKENHSSEFQFRVQDVISYTVSIGIVDKLSQYFNSIQGLIGNEEEVAIYLLDCITFLISIIKLYSDCSKTDDSTQLIATIKVTNMIGTVSLLYGLLLHSGVSSRGETPPPQLPKQIECLTLSTLCMLNHMAVMNLQAFQTILGSEGLSLQLRHITSHLFWYCSHWTSDVLLHEVILLVGYFTVLNVDNQSLIQAGQRPTVLQQLCSLPFLYFSDSQLTDILFPTLIACCYKNPSNKTILEQEMSSELLSNYIEVKYLNSEEYSNKSNKGIPEKRWLFSTRFSKNCWSSAKQYFATK